MSSDKLRTQQQFEMILSASNSIAWQSLTKAQIKNFTLNSSHVISFENALMGDALDFYYKGVLSLNEGVLSALQKSYSWATVKLYYSTFYLLRASLCCKGIAFVRKERDGFHFKNADSEKPQSNGKPDHMAAIDLFRNNFTSSDFLLSNTINSLNTYEWLRLQRENVNYKHRTFFEPDIHAIWESISEGFDNDGIEYWLSLLLNDNIYCFLEEYAVMGIPLKRLHYTYLDIIASGQNPIISPDKMNRLDSLIEGESSLRILRPYYS